MESKNKNKNEKYIINKKLLKFIGVYYISSSHPLKLFGYNFVKCIFIVEIVFLILAFFLMFSTMCYCFADINNVLNYFTIVVATTLSIFKHYCIVRNADKIWNYIKLTSVDNLSYRNHSRLILKIGRRRSKLFSVLFIFLWLASITSWILSPSLAKNYYIEISVGDEVYRYRYNIINLVYPATDKFYNDNYISYYILELFIILNWVRCTIVFDALIIALSTTISCQLKTIAHSYSTIVVQRKYHGCKLTILIYNK